MSLFPNEINTPITINLPNIFKIILLTVSSQCVYLWSSTFWALFWFIVSLFHGAWMKGEERRKRKEKQITWKCEMDQKEFSYLVGYFKNYFRVSFFACWSDFNFELFFRRFCINEVKKSEQKFHVENLFVLYRGKNTITEKCERSCFSFHQNACEKLLCNMCGLMHEWCDRKLKLDALSKTLVKVPFCLMLENLVYLMTLQSFSQLIIQQTFHIR